MVGDGGGGLAGLDDAGDAVLTRDQGGVLEDGALVQDDPAEQGEDGGPVLAGVAGNQDVAACDLGHVAPG